jgi:hypothetical protein
VDIGVAGFYAKPKMRGMAFRAGFEVAERLLNFLHFQTLSKSPCLCLFFENLMVLVQSLASTSETVY